MTSRRISYAQNAEDIRVWRAFRGFEQSALTYVDVGANEPRHLSITASLYDLGWRGLLIEADPVLASELRLHRPDDTVVEVAAADDAGELTFFRVPGTGLGTLFESEAQAARIRGFDIEEVVVRAAPLDGILDEYGVGDVHFMSIDVEGAETLVLQGLSLDRHRPWVLCVEAVLPGTTAASHAGWEARLVEHGYRFVTFDGVNRWYVADEHAALVESIATPFNAVDAGEHGWIPADRHAAQRRADRAGIRTAWQRELILGEARSTVPQERYELQIHELRSELLGIEASRAHRYANTAAKVAKVTAFRARQLLQHLPAPIQAAALRRRHLKIVTANMGHLMEPAYLREYPAEDPDWIAPQGLPPVPRGGCGLGPLSPVEAAAARDWLAEGPYDGDELLERRMDNHDDQVGRTVAALQLRLALADRPAHPHWAGGRRVLIDVRSLQTAGFGARGIGRFAKAVLLSAREAVGDERVVLLVDRGLEEVPAELVGGCSQVTRISEHTVASFSVLLQPSPMTASAETLLPILHSGARKVAVVFDFIPLHYPTVYLRDVASRAEYAGALDALRLYDEFVCISHLVRDELATVLGRPLGGAEGLEAVVAWPRDLLPDGESAPPSAGTGPIVVMTGDDGRKNTFGALAGIGAATAGDDARDVVVVGMAGHDGFVHHLAISAAMRAAEAVTAGRIGDAELHDLLAGSSLVVVSSFDEGLSLPVIEALRAGAPVVASDIPAHRELLGRGSFLADPRSPRLLAKAIRRHRARPRTQATQFRRLAAHDHVVLETVVAASLRRHAKAADVQVPNAAVYAGGRSLRVGIATPWSPQRSGVADYSAATLTELSRLCDVTVYTTRDADVTATSRNGARLKSRSIDEAARRADEHDVFVSVVGNSHFHLPFVEVIDRVDSVVLAHDTRMVEFYLALRDRGGLEKLMLRGTGRHLVSPSLDDQIEDLRLLQNAGFWEIARRSRMLITHSPTTVDRISRETGVAPVALPFANYRQPDGTYSTARGRQDSRERLGFDAGAFAGTAHVATFGFVDVRTKMIDVVVESAAWLSQWGHRVSLHVVGEAHPRTAAELTERATEAGIANFEITGFVSESVFRDYLQAVDLGVQLRISPLLGVSGPLSDMAAYGTPALGSGGLCTDVDAPAFIDRLPDDISPVTLAEALERRLARPVPESERERLRVEYLERKAPSAYAQDLLRLLTQAARTPGGWAG